MEIFRTDFRDDRLRCVVRGWRGGSGGERGQQPPNPPAEGGRTGQRYAVARAARVAIVVGFSPIVKLIFFPRLTVAYQPSIFRTSLQSASALLLALRCCLRYATEKARWCIRSR